MSSELSYLSLSVPLRVQCLSVLASLSAFASVPVFSDFLSRVHILLSPLIYVCPACPSPSLATFPVHSEGHQQGTQFPLPCSSESSGRTSPPGKRSPSSRSCPPPSFLPSPPSHSLCLCALHLSLSLLVNVLLQDSVLGDTSLSHTNGVVG